MYNWALEATEAPETSDLQDAIQKGLGRALLWAKRGLWTDKGILLNACLRDLRYDRQCEESRGPWLWQIMEAVGTINEFRDAILDSLLMVDDGLAGQQLCQFCVYYARDGGERFRQRLQEIVKRKPDPYYPALGEEELIELDGEAGFLFAARIRGESLLSGEWDWEYGSFIEDGVARIGESVVLSLLERESKLSPGMKRLDDCWRISVEAKASKSRQKHADRMREISLSKVIETAETKTNQSGFFHGWGMYADEADLRVVRDRLLNTQEPVGVLNYLGVFSNRPIPEFSERFLSFLEHDDENVRWRAFSALSKNTHPAIRKFALDHLKNRRAETNFLGLFIRNFQPGDEKTILESLCLPEDVDQRHSSLMDLRKVLVNNPEAQCLELAQIVYRLTPCGSCRHGAVKLLVNRRVAPAWLIDECQYDAIEDTRHLVKTPPVEN